MRLKIFWQVPFLFLIVLTTVSGCSLFPLADTTHVRIAVLPIVEGLPLYTAKDGGFFEKQGIQVDFIPAGSAAERDQLIAAGQVDGTINDLLAVALFNRQAAQVQVVRFAHVSAARAPLYIIAAAPKSGIKNVQDLAGVEIGISQGSIIDYATNRMLTAAGLSGDQIRTVAVPKIPDRMSLLLSGQLKAATLPQPFAAIALSSGAVMVVDDTGTPEIGNSVISFRKAFIDAHPQLVRSFVTAIDLATADLNANPEKYRNLLSTYKVVPEAMVAGYSIPRFPGNSLPTQKQFDDVVAFALERKLLENPVKFGDSVNSGFLNR